MYKYPVVLTRMDDGNIMAEIPDVPEAITFGETEAEALQWAQDALQVALSSYVDDRRDIPSPSKVQEGQYTVCPEALAGVKLYLYQEMRSQQLTQLEVARRLNADARAVRRILDLDHQSTVAQLDGMARALGFELGIDVRKASGQPGVHCSS